ncbi:hypothetical protein JCM10213_004087 [Rhodosporidiobolus nylandii]
MSDDSFAALDAILQQEASVVADLSEENARLRALLAERECPTSPSVERFPTQLNPTALYAELQATKAAQAEMYAELKAMRMAQAAAAAASSAAEDRTDEVALLRNSLADLANQLEAEKARVTALEAQRNEEVEKVTTLRSKVEESRRAVMRLQNESSKRSSLNGDQIFSFPSRRASFASSAPRRRSSLGLAAIAGSPSSSPATPEGSGVGLGFAVDSPTSTSFPPLSSSPGSTSRATPLARYAHRRGSASISVLPSSSAEEDDRKARLRELRLGVTTTHCHSRRGSTTTGLPDFAEPFDWDMERRLARRLSGASSRRNRNSICEVDESIDSSNGPPSANFRMLGRKDSLAMFESNSRRSSATDSSMSDYYNPEPALAEHLQDLQLQLQGLRIQLAESEEGRRASELCLQALKEFIAKSNTDAAPQHISLPPLPTDAAADSLGEDSRRPAPSRWTIPRLSLSRRESSATSPAGSIDRRTSNASSSAGTAVDGKPTPSLPSFGSFSFSALVNRPSSAVAVDAETSPTMPRSSTLPSGSEFPVDPSPLLSSSASSNRDDSLSDIDGDSVAPSLISDLSSRGSSRASSPEIEGQGDESPQVVVDFADEQDSLVEASRMPFSLGKSSLTTFAPRSTGLAA